MKLRYGYLTASLALACIAVPVAQAQVLKIALSSEPTSADPHYHKQTSNDALSAHIFESLINRDADMKLIPGLAASWKNLDDLTWQLDLQKGVKFSNGEPFTSQDVLFSVCRTLNNKTNITASYTHATKGFADVQTPDEHTVVIKTRQPFPLLPAELARQLPIVWNGIVPHDKLSFDPEKGCGVTAEWPTNTDFNSGKAAIGTGPYVLKAYVPGTEIDLVRNDAYWGGKPAWQEVKLLPVPNAGARMTGLLAGDYDLIENPAARDLPRIKSNADFEHTIKPSTRLIFFQLDIGRDQSPMVKAANGKNPLQDLRVRRALNMAIDRATIADRIMTGMATPTTQYMPADMFGALPQDPVVKFDPEGAKKLLAEAGYPDGFELTISTTNSRYINDSQVSQAIAQYFSRIGIKSSVDAMPSSVYFPKRAKREFSVAIVGWPSETGEASALFNLWVTTTDRPNGLGTSNYGGYTNPEFDKVFRQAIQIVDDDKRKAMLEESTRIALDQVPLIPVHFESSVWAYKKGISYEGRRDQYTTAMSAKPVK